MPIKFPDLLQDSWNFMRNQLPFSLFSVGLLMILQLTSHYIMPKSAVPQHVQSLDASGLLILILPAILFALLNILANALIILNIKAINDGGYQHFFRHIGDAVKVFLPLMLINIVMVLPLSIGVSFGGTVGQADAGLAILILPLMLSGIYIFVKLNLAPYAYLVEEPRMRVSETLKFTWGLTRGKMSMMFLFCLIAYVMPILLGAMIGRINEPTGLLVALFSGLVGTFTAIFAFRFYQVYRRMPG
ncbi:hypothetical protein [Glaesserella sp.]|uniref:hypothetical protein n=1 Tax=Glaesserella sp. TaxID=2094731 RepID=UPI00359F1F9A